MPCAARMTGKVIQDGPHCHAPAPSRRVTRLRRHAAPLRRVSLPPWHVRLHDRSMTSYRVYLAGANKEHTWQT